jgi:hypothetical protein
VIEAGHDTSFGKISFGVRLRANPAAVEHFDGNGSLQLLVIGKVNLSKAAPSQNSLDSMSAKMGGKLFSCPKTKALSQGSIQSRDR